MKMCDHVNVLSLSYLIDVYRTHTVMSLSYNFMVANHIQPIVTK